jgi:hypothetical protein
MSLLGQSRGFERAPDTSASPPKATELLHHGKWRDGPKSDMARIHSITSSAVESSVGEMVTPSAFAAFRLITSRLLKK